MEINTYRIDDILPADYNPRKALKPGDPAFEKLKRSIEKFDYVVPIVVNKRTGKVVGGHQRLAVLKTLGKTEVECSMVDLTDMEEKELNLALNKVSGQWDNDKLSDLLSEIKMFGEKEFTGFDDSEFKRMTAETSLVDQIAQETQVDSLRDKAEEIATNFETRVKDVAQQHPEKMTKALGVVIPTDGNEVLIITDPALKDFITELRRYANAGIHSPLEAVLEQVVPMKWS